MPPAPAPSGFNMKFSADSNKSFFSEDGRRKKYTKLERSVSFIAQKAGIKVVSIFNLFSVRNSRA